MAAQRAAAMAQVAVAASNPSGSTGGQKPYVCNWVAGENLYLKWKQFQAMEPLQQKEMNTWIGLRTSC